MALPGETLSSSVSVLDILATHINGNGRIPTPIPSQIHPKSHHPIPFAIIPSQSQIPSQIPFKSSGRRRTKIPPFKLALRDESNGGIPILPRLLDVEIFDEMSNGAVSKVIMPI